MSKLKIYCHLTCSTCKKALSLIKTYTDDFEVVNLLEQPPTKKELTIMLVSAFGNIRKIMNTSGDLYREMNMKDKVPNMTDDQILDILTKHGMLVKRPCILYKNIGMAGYNEKAIREILSSK